MNPMIKNATTPNADINLSGSSCESMIKNTMAPAKNANPMHRFIRVINMGLRLDKLSIVLPEN